MKKLKAWMGISTTAEKARLADMCGFKPTYLYSFVSGHRRISARVADKIARASARLADGNPRLPILLRGDLSKVCSHCPHFKACTKVGE